MAEASDSVWDVIESRRSVRAFTGEPVEGAKVDRCLEAARRAPSWANKQCWHFIVIQGREDIDELGIVPANIKNTPLLFIACGDPEKSGNLDGKAYYLVDVAIATEHLVLEAWEQGLGTVWVGALKESRVREKLGIPENIKVVAIIPAGYPVDGKSGRTKLVKKASASINRKDLKEIVHWSKW
jgi:nitroreductase